MSPPVLLEIDIPSTLTSTGSIASTPDATGPNTPANTAATEEPCTDEYGQTETEDSESRVPQKEVDSTVPSSQGESSRKKRKLTKVEKAEKEVTTALKSVMKQGSELKDTLLALDQRRAKREEKQERRENERDMKMMEFLCQIFVAYMLHTQHSTPCVQLAEHPLSLQHTSLMQHPSSVPHPSPVQHTSPVQYASPMSHIYLCHTLHLCSIILHNTHLQVCTFLMAVSPPQGTTFNL